MINHFVTDINLINSRAASIITKDVILQLITEIIMDYLGRIRFHKF